MQYFDFDLFIERAGEQKYSARVVNSPAGQAKVDFSLPFTAQDLEIFLLKIGRPRRGVRHTGSPEMEAAKTFGGDLFEAVFNGEVRSCLRCSLDEATRQECGLRLRLRTTDAPELVDLPWEYLYNPALNRFLSLSTETPIVRYLELPERIQPLKVAPPLRVLVMIASPYNFSPLEVEREWNILNDAFADLQQRGVVQLDRLEKATLKQLQSRLRKEDYHIFYFIGHGGFDKKKKDGVLILEMAC